MAVIKLKRSSTSGAVPTTGQLQDGELAVNLVDGRLFGRGNNGSPFIFEIGGANTVSIFADAWKPVDGAAPVDSFEFNDLVLLFTQSLQQSCLVYFKVPSSYLAGKQITAKLGFYSPSASNNFKFKLDSYLVRKNQDAIDSTANLNTSNSADITNTVAKQFREVAFVLTDSTGKINGVSVSPGDLIKLVLTRVAPTGTEDTADIRFVAGSTEIQF